MTAGKMPALQIHDPRVLNSGYFRTLLRFQELEQVGVDLVCVGCRHPVRETWIHFHCAPFTSFADSRAAAPMGTI